MKRFVEGLDRCQSTRRRETLEDLVEDDNAVWVIEAFVEAPSSATIGLSLRCHLGEVDQNEFWMPSFGHIAVLVSAGATSHSGRFVRGRPCCHRQSEFRPDMIHEKSDRLRDRDELRFHLHWLRRASRVGAVVPSGPVLAAEIDPEAPACQIFQQF